MRSALFVVVSFILCRSFNLFLPVAVGLGPCLRQRVFLAIFICKGSFHGEDTFESFICKIFSALERFLWKVKNRLSSVILHEFLH
jgi:hypothetical protein